MQKTIFFLVLILLGSTKGLYAQEVFDLPVFEVKGTAKKSLLFMDGKIQKQKTGDQVVYVVNLPEKNIRRVAVFNPNVEEGGFGGLRSDKTNYKIVFYGDDMLSGQKLIKGIGRVGDDDGFETVVIGEDFVTCSRSTKSFIELYHFERTDTLAMKYRAIHQKVEKPRSRYYDRDDDDWPWTQ